jgi:hypothetical protein
MRKIKNLLRDWLEISEDKFHLDAELIRMRNKIDSLEDKLSNLDDKVSDLEYSLEEKVSEYDVGDIVRDIAYYDIDDINNDLEGVIDYDVVSDTVFDLVMTEIENRDTLQELVKSEIDTLSLDNDTQYNPVDVEAIVEDVVELLIVKLRS